MAPHILNLSNIWSFTFQPFYAQVKNPVFTEQEVGWAPEPLQLLWRKVTCLCHKLMTMLHQLSNCSYCSYFCFIQSVYMLKQSYKNRCVLISSTNPIRRTEILGNTATNKFIAYLSPTIISMGKQ
jgi:hypothetical protein